MSTEFRPGRAAGIGLWVPAGSLAVRIGRGDLVYCSDSAL